MATTTFEYVSPSELEERFDRFLRRVAEEEINPLREQITNLQREETGRHAELQRELQGRDADLREEVQRHADLLRRIGQVFTSQETAARAVNHVPLPGNAAEANTSAARIQSLLEETREACRQLNEELAQRLRNMEARQQGVEYALGYRIDENGEVVETGNGLAGTVREYGDRLNGHDDMLGRHELALVNQHRRITAVEQRGGGIPSVAWYVFVGVWAIAALIFGLFSFGWTWSITFGMIVGVAGLAITAGIVGQRNSRPAQPAANQQPANR